MIVEWIVTCDVSKHKYELEVMSLVEFSTAMARGKSSIVVIITSCMAFLNTAALDDNCSFGLSRYRYKLV